MFCTVCVWVCVCVCVADGHRSLAPSEVIIGCRSFHGLPLQQPGGQTHFGEVDVALVEAAHAIRLIKDVVCDVFQVLQM